MFMNFAWHQLMLLIINLKWWNVHCFTVVFFRAGFHTAETDFLEIDRDDYPRDDSGRILWCDYNHPRIHQRCVLGCLRCKRLLVLFYDLKRCCYACYRTNAIVVEAPPDRCTTRYFYDRMKRKQNV
ncbi:hypothetical protein CRM22_006185 [Opisthorchis felineus]|uniref:Secreted protein n=1 Tax=Opisthorchis felineus TaxID=147828 RepID=A0A4S2LMB9_OPIFE|nr:hypothetical protein CRM22_006185 [Opisthorchis felineus]